MLKILRVLVTLLPLTYITAQQSAHAKTVIVDMQGEYAEIDVRLSEHTIGILFNGEVGDREKTIKLIVENSENYAPPVFFALSSVLFNDGSKDEGAFWFYAGQLRARFDANRCADVTARQAADLLSQMYGGPINEYMFQDIAKLKILIPKVVDWDRTTAYNYDHRWINLHGLDAFEENPGSKPLSVLEEEWEGIAEQTRADYLDGFNRMLSSLDNN